jgi:triacylglycerol esterase/lipase EstA (alpha/beta hydrolase family)
LKELVAVARQGWLIPQPGRSLREHGASEHLVVFVHGYFASAGVFRPMAERLAALGAGARQLHFTYLPAGSVASHAERLVERIDRAHPEGPVCIVAHSLGGLIARYGAQVLGQRLDALVTLGTPHRGTDLARPWPMRLTRELSPGSPLLKTLDDTRGRLDGTRLTSIVAVQDALVSNRSATLDRSRVVYIDGVGHHGMLYHPDAIEAVAEGIRLDARAPGERESCEVLVESGEHPRGVVGRRAAG